GRLIERLIRFRKDSGGATRRGCAVETRTERADQNDTIAAPRSRRWAGRSVTDRLRNAAGSVDLLHLPVGEERDRAAIRRPEREDGCVVCSGNQPRLQRVKGANPELTMAV